MTNPDYWKMDLMKLQQLRITLGEERKQVTRQIDTLYKQRIRLNLNLRIIEQAIQRRVNTVE